MTEEEALREENTTQQNQIVEQKDQIVEQQDQIVEQKDQIVEQQEQIVEQQDENRVLKLQIEALTRTSASGWRCC